MSKFTKKPVTIEAVLFDGTNELEVADFIDGAYGLGIFTDEKDDFTITYLVIEPLEGNHKADIGDYIIKGVQGEFYPCKPDIFRATYTHENGEEI